MRGQDFAGAWTFHNTATATQDVVCWVIEQGLAKQHLSEFLRAAPEGSFARESRAGLLREACSAAQFADLLGAEQ